MDVKAELSLYGIVPNKALGQNFLADERAICAILDAADVGDKNVLEIGPGLGALTLPLSERANKVLAVEIDKRMADILAEKTADIENVEIINADFLKVKDDMLSEKLGCFSVVANLPYYVTTPIAMKLLTSGLDIRSMTLMMQREATVHFTAEKGTKQYSPLCIMCEYLYDITEVTELSPQSYYPQPDVYSKVLHFASKGADLTRVKSLSRILTAAFSMRRKTIRNNLCNLGISKDEVKKLLDECGIEAGRRAEQLDLDDFIKMADAYQP